MLFLMSDNRTKTPLPRWLRVLLMGALVAFAAMAYWLNFREVYDAGPVEGPALVGEGIGEGIGERE
jgi:hypothetical protein